MRHLPVCVKCRAEFKPARNDVGLLDCDGNGNGVQVWCSDLLKCPVCGVEVVAGFGSAPVDRMEKDQYTAQVDFYRGLKILYECRVR